MQILPVYFLAIVVVISCGTKTTKEQQNEAQRKQLNIEKQQECNAQKKFYNNLEPGSECSSLYSLAEWECTRQGIANRSAETKSESNWLPIIDEKFAAGFTIHQCGESLKNAAVIFVKQEKEGANGSTRISIEYLSYPTAMLIAKFDTTKTWKSGICIEIPVRYWDYSIGRYVPAPLDVAGQMLWEKGDNQESSVSSHETKQASITFYTDAQCQGEGKNELRIVMPKGQDTLTVYGKPIGNRTSVLVYANGEVPTTLPAKLRMSVSE